MLIKLKKYEGLKDDDPSIMHINIFPSHDQVVKALQSQPFAGGQNTNANSTGPN